MISEQTRLRLLNSLSKNVFFEELEIGTGDHDVSALECSH
jgi:hypothetical protein